MTLSHTINLGNSAQEGVATPDPDHGKIKNSAAKVQSVIAGCSVEQCSVEQCVIAASLEGRKPFAGQIYGRGMAGGRKINCNTANFKADTILPSTHLTNRK